MNFERRDDGGLRAWSDDVPGLILSHTDIDGVLEDVVTALGVMLSEQLGHPVEARPVVDMREWLETKGIISPEHFVSGKREYAAAFVN